MLELNAYGQIVRIIMFLDTIWRLDAAAKFRGKAFACACLVTQGVNRLSVTIIPSNKQLKDPVFSVETRQTPRVNQTSVL